MEVQLLATGCSEPCLPDFPPAGCAHEGCNQRQTLPTAVTGKLLGEKGKLLGAQGARIAVPCSRLRNILLWDLGENTPKRTPVPKALLRGVRGSSSPPLRVFFFFFAAWPCFSTPAVGSTPSSSVGAGECACLPGKRVNRMGAGGRAGGAGWGAAPPSCSGGT